MNEQLVNDYVQKLKARVFDWADYYNRLTKIDEKTGTEVKVFKMEYASFPQFPLNPDNAKHLVEVEQFVRFYIENNEEDYLKNLLERHF